MATIGADIVTESYIAGADLSAAQFKIVKLDTTANTVIVCDGATDKPHGVLLNKPLSGEAAHVQYGGRTKVQADAAVSVGAEVGTSADGQAVTKTANNDWTIGRAETAAAAAGELIEVQMGIRQLGA